MDTIHIAGGDYTSGIQKRQLGKLNIGFYCDCGELVAFATTDPRKKGQIALACDGAISFTCPFCEAQQKRVASEFVEVILTESNKRKR